MEHNQHSRRNLTGTKSLKARRTLPGKICWRLTEGFGKQVLDELRVIPDVQHAVDAGVHQLFLVIAQVLGHILRYEHDVTLHVHHKEETVQGLEGEK